MCDLKKIAICGAHGTGKTQIYEKVINYWVSEDRSDYNVFSRGTVAVIPEQFRDVVKDISNFTKQTEEVTLATYGKQLYLENLYTAQGKNILCDRSVLDTFIYYDYFNKRLLERSIFLDSNTTECNVVICKWIQRFIDCAKEDCKKYSKIYLIEPSDREIENDNFRMTDKKQQLEIHKLFLEYFKDFDNVVIVNQEKQNEIAEMIINNFNI